MQTTLDRYGRVVIPKQARDRAGLAPGSELEVVVTDDGLMLKPIEEQPAMLVREGVLVFTGEPLEDVEAAVGAHRNQRLADLARVD